MAYGMSQDTLVSIRPLLRHLLSLTTYGEIFGNFQENKSGSSGHKSGLGTPLRLPAGKGHLFRIFT